MENEQFDLAIVWVDADSTGRGIKPGTKLLENLIKQKDSVIQIKNKDEKCCARALSTAQAMFENHEKLERIKKYDVV